MSVSLHPATDQPTPASLRPAEIAEHYAARLELWRPRLKFDDAERWYSRLAETAEYEVWLLSWLPGQGTEIHDHGESSGAFTVVQGELTERTFRATGPAHPAAWSLSPGSTRSFGRHYIHEVTNSGTQPAVSIHVYSPALATMSYYRQDADGALWLHQTEAVAE